MLARMRGPKARKHTRWWDTGETKGIVTVAERETKAVDPGYVVPEKLTDELGDEITPVMIRVATDAARGTAKSLDAQESIADLDFDEIAAAVDEAVARILGVAQRHAREVRGAVLAADEDAESLDDVVDRIERAHRKGGNWLLLSGRALANGLTNDAALRTAVRLGVTHTQWLSKRDDRVRPTHVVADGQVRPVGELFKVGRFHLKHPCDPSELPESWGEVANCFVADTEVAGPDIEGSFRAPYVGEIVTLRTAQGRSLTGTPNHPILTERGWVPLGELNETDHVIGTRVGHDVGPGVEPDVEGSPATIEQVHNALATRAPTQGVAGAAVNFHGDRPAGQVDVVVVDSALRVGRHASLGEQVSENYLPRRSETGEGGADTGAADQLFSGGNPAASRRMGSSDKGFTSSGIELCPAQEHGFRAPAWLYAAAKQARPDGGAVDPQLFAEQLLALASPVASQDLVIIDRDARGHDLVGAGAHGDSGVAESAIQGGRADAELSGDLAQRLAGAVELDRVIEIERKPFRGHVYTLQATTGMFIANSIPTKNCRCGLLFQKPSDAARKMNAMIEAARTNAGAPGKTFDVIKAAVEAAAASRTGETLTPTPDGYDLPPVASIVQLMQPIVAYRVLSGPLAATPGQTITLPGRPVLALAPPASGIVLTVMIPAGVEVGVAGGAVMLAEGTQLSLLGIAADEVRAQVLP